MKARLPKANEESKALVKSPIQKLPAQLINYTLPYLDPLSRHRLAKMTCRLYKAATHLHMDRFANQNFDMALGLIVAGVPEEKDKDGFKIQKIRLFQDILNANCNLEFLTKRGTVVNYAGDPIEDATLLQVAWGEDDYELVEMIFDRFAALGEYDEALNQLDARRFPEEKEVKEDPAEINKRKREIWDPIIAAVTNNKEDELKAAHKPFLDWVMKPIPIKQGKHFVRKKMIEEADRIYKSHWGLWNGTQCLLFCDYIFGILVRNKVSASYGEDVCAGIDGRLRALRSGDRTSKPRSHKLQNGDDLHTQDFSLRAQFYCVDIFGERSRGTAPHGWVLLSLVGQTQQDLESLKTAFRSRSSNRNNRRA